MSNDLVNQLTLNFLISKAQLQKLNKKAKETSDQKRLREIQEYNDRIKNLFCDLLVCQAPDDLLFEVKNTFDNFIDKAIYYFKAHDNNNDLEMERSVNDIKEDIDYEKEAREIENGNYLEEGQELEEDKTIHNPVIVKSKYNITNSIGVSDIQKLPLNWFENVQQNYKKNQIIPRKKEQIIADSQFSDVKKKI